MTAADDAKLRMLPHFAEYVMKMEAVMKAYYQEHQAKGCTCEICRRAEIAYLSAAHAGGPGEIGLHVPSSLWAIEEMWKLPER
jgi:hypothetical protein